MRVLILKFRSAFWYMYYLALGVIGSELRVVYHYHDVGTGDRGYGSMNVKRCMPIIMSSDLADLYTLIEETDFNYVDNVLIEIVSITRYPI